MRSQSYLSCLVFAVLSAAAACRGDRRLHPDSAAAVAAPIASVAAAPVDTERPIPRGVGAYLSFVQMQRAAATDSVARASDLAVEGLSRLAVALAELSAEDTTRAAELRPRIGVLQARVDSLAQLPDSAGRSRLARDGFTLASEVLEVLQARRPPALTDRVAEVRAAAATIRTEEALDAQRESVLRALDRSAAAVRGLTGAPPP